MIKRLARGWLWLRHRVLGRRYKRLVLETVDGMPLVVLPDVFNPVLFRTGALLGQVAAREMGAGRSPGGSSVVLDLGCGSGIGAITAALRGRKVVAVDTNPEALRCTRINALLNHVESAVTLVEGDLFEPLDGQLFEFVLFNPPFYCGQPRNLLDQAWRGDGVFERFADGLGHHLAPGGACLLSLSTDGEQAKMLALLGKHCYRISTVVRKDFGNEIVSVYRVERAEDIASVGSLSASEAGRLDAA